MAAYNAIQDKSFTDARRHLDPYWEQKQGRFDQQMVNRGFSPGSKGYDREYSNLNRAQDDAYSGAAFDALQFGSSRLDADRAFGENKRQFNKGYGLAKDQFREGASQFDRGFGESQRQFDEGTRRYDEGFGEGNRRFDLGFGEGQRQFDLPFGENQYRDRREFGEGKRRYDQEFDLNRMLNLDNVSRAYSDQAYRDTVYNASREDQQIAQMMSLMGFAPTGGAQPFNMGSAFNNSLAGDIYSNQYGQQQTGNLIDSLGSFRDMGGGDWLSGLFGGGSGSQPSWANSNATTGNF